MDINTIKNFQVRTFPGEAYYLGEKGIRVVVSGVKGLPDPTGLAINPTDITLIWFKPKW